MKSFLTGIFLVSLRIYTVLGQNTTCYKCDGLNKDYCSGVEHQCPNGSICMTIYEDLTLGKTYHSIRKRCSQNLPCNGSWYAFRNDTYYIEIKSECCEGNLCNNGTYQEWKRPKARLGPKCPVCASEDTSKLCTPTSHIICRDDTDRCTTLRAKFTTPDGAEGRMSAQGCMSASACDFPDYSYPIGFNIYSMFEHECYLPKTENAEYEKSTK